MEICAIWYIAADRIVLMDILGYQRYDYDQVALKQRFSNDLWDLLAT